MAALPLLTTSRLRVDALTVDDCAGYQALYLCPEVSVPAGLPVPDEKLVHEWFNGALTYPQSEGRILALHHCDIIPLIGVIRLTEWDRRSGVLNLGYCLSPTVWGQGLMHEALSMLLPWIMDGGLGEKLHRVQAWVLTHNERSHRLLARLGFNKEGVLRGLYYDNQHHLDVCAYGLLKSDLRSATGQDMLHSVTHGAKMLHLNG